MPYTEEQRLARMRSDKLRDLGRPMRLKSGEFDAAEKVIRDFHSRGMSAEAISEATGLNPKTVGKIVFCPPGTIRRMDRSKYDRALAMEFRPPESGQKGAHIPVKLSVRRVGALWAAGFTLKVQAQELGSHEQHLSRMCRGTATIVHYDMVQRIETLYDKLRYADPLDYQTETATLRARAGALARGHAPPSCWDDDTIGDPDAIPEWTGACGTGRGKWIHQRDNIPMCKPCSKQSVRYVKMGGDEDYDFDLDRFKVLAERSGLGKDDLADGIGIAFATLNRWLAGQRQPSPDKLEDVAAFFRVHVGEFKL